MATIDVIRQDEIAECGHACLLMVASYWGYKLDLPTYRREFFVSDEGASFADLSHNALQFKLVATGYQIAVNELKYVTTPCILSVYGSHFVVIEKLSSRFIHVIDPASGRRKIPLILLPQLVGGVGESCYVLEFAKKPEFVAQDLRQKISLINIIKLIKGIGHSYSQVFLFALIIQLAVLAHPFYVQLAMDDVIVNNDTDLMFLLLSGFIAISIFDVIARFTRESLVISLGKSITKDFGLKFMQRLLELPVEYFSSRHAGNIVQRFEVVEKIMTTIARITTTIFMDGLMSIIMLLLMFVYSVKLTLIVLALVVGYILIKLASYAIFRRLNTVYLHDAGDEKTAIIENVTHINAIKSGNIIAARAAQHKIKLEKKLVTSKKLEQWNNIFSLLSNIIQHADTLIIVYIGVSMITAGEFTVGMLYAFIFYKGQFVATLIQSFDEYIQVLLSKVDIRYVQDVLSHETENEREEVVSMGDNSPSQAKTIIYRSYALMYDLKSDICFKNFTFCYPKVAAPVFTDFNCTIAANQSASIMGRSGRGKSTLLNVIAGLYRPRPEQSYIGEHDITTIPLSYLRAGISYYSPAESFFSGDLVSNISLHDNNVDIALIIDILHGLDLYDYVMAHIPGGLTGYIGAINSRFSTGQKKRLMLARALYKKSSLLLLDEPTESLDSQTEAQVIDYLFSLNKRMIFVTHNIKLAAKFTQMIEL